MKFQKLAITFTLLILPEYLFSESKYLSIASDAADYVCSISKEKSKSRFAIFPFTDSKEEETKESEIANTEVVSALLKCEGLKLIDKSKIAKVIDEQSFAKTGIIDSETAPEMGKLIGAEGLVFGELIDSSLQIRIVDSETGEILGANVQSAQEKPARVKRLANEEVRKDFDAKNIFQFLRRMKNNRPVVFVFVCATQEEFSGIQKKFPKRAQMIQKRISNLEPEKKQKLDGLKDKVQNARKNNPKLNRWVSEKLIDFSHLGD
ncbi:MAG: hypothetical protein IT569_08685 [Leptospiraceae bacterium]|nr:hypothetical protein [Leptospiraceae bacterium]